MRGLVRRFLHAALPFVPSSQAEEEEEGEEGVRVSGGGEGGGEELPDTADVVDAAVEAQRRLRDKLEVQRMMRDAHALVGDPFFVTLAHRLSYSVRKHKTPENVLAVWRAECVATYVTRTMHGLSTKALTSAVVPSGLWGVFKTMRFDGLMPVLSEVVDAAGSGAAIVQRRTNIF